jgi:hypothetical protein
MMFAASADTQQSGEPECIADDFALCCLLLRLQEVAAARVVAAEGVLLVAGSSSNSLAQLLATPHMQHVAGQDGKQVRAVRSLVQQMAKGFKFGWFNQSLVWVFHINLTAVMTVLLLCFCTWADYASFKPKFT